MCMLIYLEEVMVFVVMSFVRKDDFFFKNFREFFMFFLGGEVLL